MRQLFNHNPTKSYSGNIIKTKMKPTTAFSYINNQEKSKDKDLLYLTQGVTDRLLEKYRPNKNISSKEDIRKLQERNRAA